MEIQEGSQARAKTDVRIRAGRGTSFKVLATLKKDALAVAVEAPVNGWGKFRVSGWSTPERPTVIYSEPDERSSVDAVRGGAQWNPVDLIGFISVAHLEVIDGSL